LLDLLILTRDLLEGHERIERIKLKKASSSCGFAYSDGYDGGQGLLNYLGNYGFLVDNRLFLLGFLNLIFQELGELQKIRNIFFRKKIVTLPDGKENDNDGNHEKKFFHK